MVFKRLFQSLEKGDKIGIASVSGKTDLKATLNGEKFLEDLGYSLVYSDNIEKSRRYMSGSDDQRLEGFLSLLRQEDIKGIIFARGGYGVLRIINRIDFSEIEQFNGFFMGYSDNSILLNLIAEKTENIVFHGPNLSELEKSDSVFLENIFKGKIFKELSTKPIFINPGKASGILGGGNLTSLSSLCGTGYLPDFRNKVLFIEDVNEPPYKIDRMLTQMRLCGCFREIRGVVAGSFEGCGKMELIFEILLENFKNIPFVFLNCFGHGSTNNPLVLGEKIEIDSFSKRVVYV
ncbi:MAG: LD-carboxypeptidase [Desulforegulaceae bacterium]|nr:LD-carboxypeptidase [Desulforegulaceae bacterium]